MRFSARNIVFMQTTPDSSPRQRLQGGRGPGLLILCCLIAFLLGLITAAIGPCLGDIAQKNSSNLAAVGSVFSALFLGALVAQLIAGPLGDRLGQGFVLVGGLVLLALGVAGLSFSTSLPLTLAAVCLAGLGHGSSDLSSLILAAERYKDKSVSALNLIGLLFGAGAFAGPALAGAADRLWGSTLPVLWLGLGGVVLLLPFAFIQTRGSKLSSVTAPNSGHTAAIAAESFGTKTKKVLGNPLVWALGCIFIVYGGAENSMGGWTAEYVKQTTGAAFAVAALAASLFWLALAGGRLLAAAFGTRLKPNAVLGAGIVLALIGAGLLAASTGRLALSLVAIALVGAGYGSIYPTAFAMAAAAAPEAPGSATSIVAALGSLGGMVFPWAQGLILVGWGTGAAALFMLALGFLMLLFFFLQRGVAARMHAKNAGR